MIIPSPTDRAPGTSVVYTDGSGTLRVIAFDATIQDDHAGSSTVSSHALDVNANVANHVRSENRRLSLEAEVTDTPVIAPPGYTATETAVQIEKSGKTFAQFAGASVSDGPFIPGFGRSFSSVSSSAAVQDDSTEIVEARTMQYADGVNRVREVWEALDALRESGTVVSVLTRLHDYQEMAILYVGAPHGIADSIVFRLEFEEIRRATSEVIQVEPRVTEKRAEKKKAAGAQPYKDPTEANTTKTSAALKLFEALQ